jgi:putative sigma-54 modulation protein
MSNITITGHHVEVTDAIKSYVLKKFERIERHFERITKIHVTLKVEKNSQIAEATVQMPGHTEFFAKSIDANLYAAIDALSDKLNQQITKHKEKSQG